MMARVNAGDVRQRIEGTRLEKADTPRSLGDTRRSVCATICEGPQVCEGVCSWRSLDLHFWRTLRFLLQILALFLGRKRRHLSSACSS